MRLRFETIFASCVFVMVFTSGTASTQAWHGITPHPSNDPVELIGLVGDKDEAVRDSALIKLWTRGLDSRRGLGDLLKSSRDPSPEFAGALRFILWSWHLGWAEQIPGCIDLLERPEPNVRIAAAVVLGLVSPRESTAVQALMQALDDSNDMVRCAAIDSLVMLDESGPDFIEKLCRCSGSGFSPDVRASAIKALGDIGPTAGAAKRAVPILIEIVKNPPQRTSEGPQLVDLAVEALADFGAEARDAVPAVLESVRLTFSLDGEIARIRFFGAVGPEARVAVPCLVDFIERHASTVERHDLYESHGKGTMEVALEAANALRAIAPEDPEVQIAIPKAQAIMENPEAFFESAGLDLIGGRDEDDFNNDGLVDLEVGGDKRLWGPGYNLSYLLLAREDGTFQWMMVTSGVRAHYPIAPGEAVLKFYARPFSAHDGLSFVRLRGFRWDYLDDDLRLRERYGNTKQPSGN